MSIMQGKGTLDPSILLTLFHCIRCKKIHNYRIVNSTNKCLDRFIVLVYLRENLDM